jgi:hypothetical protein
MKAFAAACVVAIVIAVGGALVLGHLQESAETAFSTTAVRV